MRNGTVYLRHSGDRAIAFEHNGEVNGGEITVGVVRGLGEGSYGQMHRLATIEPMVGTVPGYTRSSTDDHRFVFGVEGNEVYVKFNGVEFLREKTLFQMESGRVSFRAPTGYGFRRTVVSHKAAKGIYSDFTADPPIWDVRDDGVFSTVRLKGSIEADSTRWTVEEDPGNGRGFAYLNKGDRVLIGVGAEPGLGLRGTVGVGGTWPRLSYADKAAMDADSSQEDDRVAWTEDDGAVYQWSGSSWGRLDGKPYYSKAVPRGLSAEIVDIDPNGQWVELSEPAQASVHGVFLWQDPSDRLTDLFEFRYDRSDFMAPGVIQLQRGDYAVSKQVRLEKPQDGWVFQGQGRDQTRIFSPDGIRSATIKINGGTDFEIRDLHLQGNAGFERFGFKWDEKDKPFGGDYPTGVHFSLGRDNVARQLLVTDAFQKAVGVDSATNIWAEDVDVVMTEGLPSYVQWLYQWSDTVDGGCRRCTVTSPTMISGFETFRGENTKFIDCEGTNAAVAVNSGGDYLFENLKLTILEGSQERLGDRYLLYDPLINLNNHLDNPLAARGGEIRNLQIEQTGPVNSDGLIYRAISATPDNHNTTITGGELKFPDGDDGRALELKGDNTLVDGLVTNNRSDKYNIYVSDGVVRDCVAYEVKVGPDVTVENCVTPDGDPSTVERQ
jgi:hypothetical protein